MRIVVADEDPATCRFYLEALPRLGHEVIAVAHQSPQLVEACLSLSPDLVVTEARLGGEDTVRAAAAVCRARPTPIVLVSASDALERVDIASHHNVLAWLVKPVREPTLAAAVVLARAWFLRLQALGREAAELRQSLEDRKLIERAKGAVMRRLRVGEEEAYRRLCALSNRYNRKLVEAARIVLGAEEIFRELEQVGGPRTPRHLDENQPPCPGDVGCPPVHHAKSPCTAGVLTPGLTPQVA